MKLYKCRKLGNSLYRIFMSLSKFLFMFVMILFFSVLAFGCLGIVIAYLDCPELINNQFSLRFLWNWYQNRDNNSSGYVASMVGAMITALLTAITIYQSHYTRKQDRVFSFSKNEVTKISIGLDKSKNVSKADPYLQMYEGNVLINLEYEEAFSKYYIGHPIVIYVLLEKNGKRKFKFAEKLKIYAYKYYNKNKKVNLMLETGNSSLLYKYINKSDKNFDNRLSILLDIRWCNSLLPWYNRGLSALYIRENIELDYGNETSKKGENSYNISNSHHTYIYLLSFQWIRIIFTKFYFGIKKREREKDRDRMKNYNK